MSLFGGNLLYNPLTALDSVHGTRRFFLLRDALSPLSSLPKICFYLVKFRITKKGHTDAASNFCVLQPFWSVTSRTKRVAKLRTWLPLGNSCRSILYIDAAPELPVPCLRLPIWSIEPFVGIDQDTCSLTSFYFSN